MVWNPVGDANERRVTSGIWDGRVRNEWCYVKRLRHTWGLSCSTLHRLMRTGQPVASAALSDADNVSLNSIPYSLRLGGDELPARLI
jgi:hypothetical protein